MTHLKTMRDDTMGSMALSGHINCMGSCVVNYSRQGNEIKIATNKPDMKTVEEMEQWAFETFAKLHPQEAHELNAERFCKYVRTINPELSDQVIRELLNQQI